MTLVGDYKISLTNLLGVVVMEKEYTQTDILGVDTKLLSGVYQLTILNKNTHEQITKKVVFY